MCVCVRVSVYVWGMGEYMCVGAWIRELGGVYV